MPDDALDFTNPDPVERAADIILNAFLNAETRSAHSIAQALSDAGLLLPEGFVAVPREPTEAMIEAGNNALVSWVAPAMHSAHAYRAMIQAQETQG